MFGPVITTEAHLASAGARTHSNNTADMSAMIEALSFLRDANSCIYYISKHAAGVCLGTVQAPHTHPAGTCVRTVDAESPAQVTVCHATRVRPYRESGKLMC